MEGEPACESDTIFSFLGNGLNKKKITFNFREVNIIFLTVHLSL